MKDPIKKRWVGLLESGEYNLGRGMLYSPTTDSHCVLGVLVEMAIDEGVFEPEVGGSSNKYLENVSGFVLNDEIREWAGLSKGQARTISAVNDDRTNGPEDVIKYIKEKV